MTTESQIKSAAMDARLKQIQFQLRILKLAVADVSPESWQAKALWTVIQNISDALTDTVKPLWEEHPTNQYNLSEAWGILSAWDDESDEEQCAERIAALKKRFKDRVNPNDRD